MTTAVQPSGTSLVRRARASAATWAIVGLLFLGAVQVASHFLPPYLFPSVPQLVESTVEAVSQNHGAIIVTAARFVVALLAAITVGWLTGLLMSVFPHSVGRLLRPIFSVVQAVPALSWVLLAVLWLHDVEARVFAVVFVIALPFYVLAVVEGVRALDSDLFDAVAQFRPTRGQTFWILFVPQSLVYVLLTTRTAASFCLRILVFAELIAATTGVGREMSLAQTNFDVPQIFAWSVILILINIALIAGLDRVEGRLLRWRKEAVVR